MTAHVCAECGGVAQGFANETFPIAHEGMEVSVANLSGRRCGECGEVEFDHASALRYAQASDALVVEARTRQAAELRQTRKKLGLTQSAAARIAGGGHNAFSRYERGEVSPVAAVINLFKLLGNHPDLLAELDVTRGPETQTWDTPTRKKRSATQRG